MSHELHPSRLVRASREDLTMSSVGPWGMTGWQRMYWWGFALLGAGAAVGLLVWVTAAHLEGSGQAWGVAGSVAGVAALGVSLWQLRVPGPGPAPVGGPPVAPPAPFRRPVRRRR